MKRRYDFSLLIGLLFCTYLSYGQHYKDTVTKGLISFAKLKADIFGSFGIEWEQKISKASVIDLFSGVVIGKTIDYVTFLDFKTPLGVVPASFAEYRNYYNLHRRINEQKNMHNNSGNFLFGRAETFFPIKNQNYFNLLLIQG